MARTIETPRRDRPYVIAEAGDWRATLRQSLPALPRILGALRPTWSLPAVCAITPAFLREAGIRVLLWDVDGTLTDHHSKQLDAEASPHFERLLSVEGLTHAVVSNCGEERFAELATVFPALPVIKVYRGPAGVVARVRTADRDEWSAEPVGELRPLRKPDPVLIESALRVLGVDDRRGVAMVGDQCLTDVAAANLAGIASVKVPTIGRTMCPPAVRVLQTVDSALFRVGEVMVRRNRVL